MQFFRIATSTIHRRFRTYACGYSHITPKGDTIMRTLVRRIKTLESYAAKQRGVAARSFDKVVHDLHRGRKAGQLDLLISAFGGQRTGRPLTPDEAEVMKQFWEHAKDRFQ